MKATKKKAKQEIRISVAIGSVIAVDFPDDCPYQVKIYNYDTEGMTNAHLDEDGQECHITTYPTNKKSAKGDRKRPSAQTKLVKTIHTEIIEVLDDWGWRSPSDTDSEEFEEDLRNAIVTALDPIKGER